MKLLVTGGAGYVGSHFVWSAVDAGHEVVVLDNLSTGHAELLPDIELLQLDLMNRQGVQSALVDVRPDAVVHFAALSLVEESMREPERYLRVNVEGTRNLLDAMRSASVGRLVVSSSAAVYGAPEVSPVAEDAPLNPLSPYGVSKVRVEELVQSRVDAGQLGAVCLRYFNAAGADEQGRTGERHNPETHLIPRALRAAAGLGPSLTIYGTDFPTRDGTCVRDYVHVADLAEGHLAALRLLETADGGHMFNLGTGRGHTVREVLSFASLVVGKPLVAHEQGRRPGDPAVLLAEVGHATRLLGWKPQRNLMDTLQSAWAWHCGAREERGDV